MRPSLQLVNGLQEREKPSELHATAKGETEKPSLRTCPKRQTGDYPPPAVSPSTSADTQEKTRQYWRAQQTNGAYLLSKCHFASARQLLWPNCADTT